MWCYSCGTEFKIFKREVGCEACGFSFCGKCCKKHEIVTALGETKKQLLCNKCFTEKSKGETSNTIVNMSPPSAHKKRMETLKKQSYSVDSGKHVLLQSQWSDEKDKEIAERLQKLKRDRFKDILSEQEIEERLAKLKGMDPSRYNAPPIEVFRPDRRTSTEKATSLLSEITEQVELESKISKSEDDALAARLAKLKASSVDKEDISKDENVAPSEKILDTLSEEKYVPQTEEEQVKSLLEQFKCTTSSQPEHTEDIEMTEDEEAEKLMEKLLASNLEEDMEELDSLGDQEAEKPHTKADKCKTEEEFPWCVICTEDAKIRCFGCEADLYCSRCFKECHDSLDINDHTTCPFLSPRKSALH